MKHNLLKLLSSIIGCELVGIAGSYFTFSAIPTWYATLNKPFFAPPNWLFAPVWTTLYLLMGVSFYLIWNQRKQSPQVQAAQKIFLVQLFFNFLWSPLFFGLRSPELGLVGIVVLWFYILMTIRHFYPISKIAAYLLILYLLWVSFATLLNSSIALIN